MGRRSYAGGAQPTTLASSVNSTTTILSAVALIGWPIPTNPFFAVIDRDTPDEEKILCQSVNGNDLTVLRGQDGTVARDHSAGAALEHVFTATDADEANAHVNDTTGVHGTPVGDGFVFRNAVQTLTNKTLDFGVTGANIASNIPRVASPEIDAALTAEANTRAAADAALSQWDTDHLAAVDPHPQYLTPAEGAALIGAAVPAGTVAMFAGANIPTGWLLCDGSTVSRASYSALFAALQTTYGAGDGSTTFGLPNFGGLLPVGTDGSNALNSSGGANTATLTAANLPKHTHTSPQHTHAVTTVSGGSHAHLMDVDIIASNNHVHGNVGGASATEGGPSNPGTGGIVGAGTSEHSHTGTAANNAAANTGDGGAALTATPVAVRNAYRAINFIIKV